MLGFVLDPKVAQKSTTHCGQVCAQAQTLHALLEKELSLGSSLCVLKMKVE